MADDSLKMSLGEIRSLIDIQKEEWIHMGTTNCYAYALGLDVAESDIIPYAYAPGIISHSDIDLTRSFSFSYENLLKNIYLDLEALEIDYREINPLDSVSDEEWKIALFTTDYFGLLEDYHFLRCHNDGIWYYKDGYRGGVFGTDSFGHIIYNPRECIFRKQTYQKVLSLRLR